MLSIKNVIATIVPILIVLGGMSVMGHSDALRKEFEYDIQDLTPVTANVIELTEAEGIFDKSEYKIKYEDLNGKTKEVQFLSYEELVLNSPVEVYCSEEDETIGVIANIDYECKLLTNISIVMIALGIVLEVLAFVPVTGRKRET